MILDDIRQLTGSGKWRLRTSTYSAFFPIAAFVAGANVTINIQINNDADFLIRFTTFGAFTAAGVFAPDPDYLLTLLDLGSGLNLQDIGVHISCCSGNGQLPYVWPEPYRLAAGSVLACTLQNNAPTANGYLSFQGYKILPNR
jgi:hypothetical protein